MYDADKSSSLVITNKELHIFNSEVDLKITYHLKDSCSITTIPRTKPTHDMQNNLVFHFAKGVHKGILDVRCR